MEQEFNINVPSDYNGQPIVIDFRKGESPKVNNLAKFAAMLVTVSTIHNFVAGRKYGETPKENTGVVQYSLQPASLGLKFLENPQDELAPVVTAKLELNPDLIAFGTNRDVFFDSDDLKNHVRKYAHCFADISQAQKLISSLQNFDIKFEQTHKKEDDRRGNVNDQVKQSLKFVKGEVPLAWELIMPLFKGTPDVKFTVEIEIEAKNGHPEFAFYSMDLELLLREKGPAYIQEEVKKFETQFVCLETLSV